MLLEKAKSSTQAYENTFKIILKMSLQFVWLVVDFVQSINHYNSIIVLLTIT